MKANWRHVVMHCKRPAAAILLVGMLFFSACGTKEPDVEEVLSVVEESAESALSEVQEEAEETSTPTPTPSPTPTATPTSEPKGPGYGKTVVIDPGHSAAQKGESVPIGPGASEWKDGDTSGTHGAASGLNEYDLTMTISQQLREELEERDYTVLLTHEDNQTAINCDERAMVANDANADCFIRIHADGAGDPSAAGAMAICITPQNPWTAETYEESRRLSDAVLEAYCKETEFYSRGVLEEDNMTGNNWAKVPTTLLELGFMTNAEEDLRMADPEFQKKMVAGIVNGINQYMEGSSNP